MTLGLRAQVEDPRYRNTKDFTDTHRRLVTYTIHKYFIILSLSSYLSMFLYLS